jgi:formylglycine-generating enzyme required for sulfatase activity
MKNIIILTVFTILVLPGVNNAWFSPVQFTRPAVSSHNALHDDNSDPFYESMVVVKGGSFIMGCLKDVDSEFCDEKSSFKVTLSDFEIGQTEVTQAQWRAVMGSDPPLLHFKGCDLCPVESVSWYDVQLFLEKLNAMTGKKYRLPTSAEWEYAARGGAKSSTRYKYAGSNDVMAVAWIGLQEGCKGRTFSVKGKKPNDLGLFDMTGNVREWCSDWIHWSDKYKYDRPEFNPTGPENGEYKITRGCSFDSDINSDGEADSMCMLSWSYGGISPSFKMDNLGFRVARSLN